MISAEVYKFFSQYVFENSGILYKESDYYRLDSRINTLVKSFNLGDAEQLLKMYQGNITPRMHDELIDLFTNNETYFMRDLKPFMALAKGMLPALREQSGILSSINIWSCACSSGQEIYSILMALDSFGSPELFPLVRIDATDISKEVLSRAKAGIYSGLEVQRGLPAAFLLKYFIKSEDNKCWKIKPDLKSRVSFREFNLLKDSYPLNKYDIIFCRNVLIYQDMENKKKILNDIYHALRPGGYLVFGAGESLIGIDLPLQQVNFEGASFYQKET